MGALFVITILALSIWAIFTTFKRLNRLKVGHWWWFAFVCLAAIGLLLGYWLAFHFDYQVSQKLRFISFPMPLGFFHLENGQWIDFPTPEYVMYPGLAANILAITAFAIMPVLVGSLLIHRRR